MSGNCKSYTIMVNPKLEYRNPKQIRNSNFQMTETAIGNQNVLNINILNIVSNFVLRISNL